MNTSCILCQRPPNNLQSWEYWSYSLTEILRSLVPNNSVWAAILLSLSLFRLVLFIARNSIWSPMSNIFGHRYSSAALSKALNSIKTRSLKEETFVMSYLRNICSPTCRKNDDEIHGILFTRLAQNQNISIHVCSIKETHERLPRESTRARNRKRNETRVGNLSKGSWSDILMFSSVDTLTTAVMYAWLNSAIGNRQ